MARNYIIDDTKYEMYISSDDAEIMTTAAYELNKIPGCEFIVNALKQKIEETFEDVPEKDGQKILENVTYQSNGLVFVKGSVTCKEHQNDYYNMEKTAVMCSPWNSQTLYDDVPDPDEKPKKLNFRFDFVRGHGKDIRRDNNIMWAQCRIACDLPVRLQYDSQTRNMNVIATLQKLERMWDTFKKETDIIPPQPVLDFIETSVQKLTQFLYTLDHGSCLSDEGVDKVINAYKMLYPDKKSLPKNEWGIYNSEEPYIEPLIKEYSVSVSDSFKQVYITTYDKQLNDHYNRYHIVHCMESILDVITAFDKTEVDTLRYTFQKLKILSDDYTPDRTKLINIARLHADAMSGTYKRIFKTSYKEKMQQRCRSRDIILRRLREPKNTQ